MINKILNNNLDFFKEISKHIDEINKIYIFEDILEKYIYYYAFLSDNNLISTKSKSYNNFDEYTNKYVDFLNNNNFYITKYNNQIKALKK